MSKVGLSNSFILTKQKTPMLIYQNLKHPLHETYAAYGIKTKPMGETVVCSQYYQVYLYTTQYNSSFSVPYFSLQNTKLCIGWRKKNNFDSHT